MYYTTLHCTTLQRSLEAGVDVLHYTTLHYTTLHYTALHYSVVLRPVWMYYTTLHCTTLHYTNTTWS